MRSQKTLAGCAGHYAVAMDWRETFSAGRRNCAGCASCSRLVSRVSLRPTGLQASSATLLARNRDDDHVALLAECQSGRRQRRLQQFLQRGLVHIKRHARAQLLFELSIELKSQIQLSLQRLEDRVDRLAVDLE